MLHNLLMEYTGRARYLAIDTIAWSGLPKEFHLVVLEGQAA